MKIGGIVIDCTDFDKMAAFWQEALHYVPREPAKGGWVVLKDPSGSSPNVSLNQKSKPLMDSKKLGWRLSDKIRLHIDLYTSDQKGEVERLLKIGATLIRRPKKGEDFVILADPENNHFCVIQKDKP